MRGSLESGGLVLVSPYSLPLFLAYRISHFLQWHSEQCPCLFVCFRRYCIVQSNLMPPSDVTDCTDILSPFQCAALPFHFLNPHTTHTQPTRTHVRNRSRSAQHQWPKPGFLANRLGWMPPIMSGCPPPPTSAVAVAALAVFSFSMRLARFSSSFLFFSRILSLRCLVWPPPPALQAHGQM